MATITIPKKQKQLKAGQGRMMRISVWSHEYIHALSDRTGRPMCEVLELVLRQVNVKEATP